MNCLLLGFNSSSSRVLKESLLSRYEDVFVIYDDNNASETTKEFDLHKLRAGEFKNSLPHINGRKNLNINVPFWSDEHIVALKMLGRQARDQYSISFEERNAFFFNCWRYAYNFIYRNKISLILFRTIPHFGFEYIMMEVAKELNVVCLSKEDAYPLSASFIIDLHKRDSLIEYKSPSKTEKNIKEINKKILLFIKQQTNEDNIYHPDYFEKNRNNAKFNKNILSLFQDIFVDLIAIILRLNKPKYVSLVHRSYQKKYFNSSATEFSWRLAKWIARFGAIKNSKAYRDLAKNSPAPEGYLVVSSYQPERTTIPDCGIYGDLLTFINLVTTTIGNNTKILFKEHPSNFNFPINHFYRGYLYRSPFIYNALSQYENLNFIPEDVSLDTYLSKCHTVIGQSSSVVYQASFLGKKAICFAPSWFSACPIVHSVKNADEFKDALNAPQPVKKDVIKIWQEYLNNLIPISFPLSDLRFINENNHKEFKAHLLAVIDCVK